jgi:hypothetical protein
MKVHIEDIDHWINALKRMKTEYEFDYEGFDSYSLSVVIEKLEYHWSEVKKEIGG